MSDTIKNKIKKLLALAGNNPNEAERMEAMQMAMKLLEQHDLSLSDVEHYAEIQQIEEQRSEFRAEKWIRFIAEAAALMYGCKSYFYPKGSVYFVGIRGHIEVAQDIARWLIQGIRNEANSTFTDQRHRNSFKLGAATNLILRAREWAESQKRQATDNPERKNQLIKINALESYYDKLGCRSSKSRNYTASASAYERGSNYGAGINLNKQVSTATHKRIGVR